MKEIFKRNVPGTTEILQKSTVAVAGCGTGRLILVDSDTIELSNLNRQYYLRKHVGMEKVEALALAVMPHIIRTLQMNRFIRNIDNQIKFNQGKNIFLDNNQFDVKKYEINEYDFKTTIIKK